MPYFYDPLQRFLDILRLPPGTRALYVPSRYEKAMDLQDHYSAMREQGYYLKDIVVADTGQMRIEWGGPEELTEHGILRLVAPAREEQ